MRLAPLPPAEYRGVSRSKQISCGQTVEIVVRQLVTPAVLDAVTGQPMACGPELDDAEGRKRFAATNPTRVYAAAKRQLSKRDPRKFRKRNLAKREASNSAALKYSNHPLFANSSTFYSGLKT